MEIFRLPQKLGFLRLRGWFYPLLLLAVMVLTYGLQMPRLGFFWDDWQAVYLSRFGDAGVYWRYFLSDRPFSVWTYILTMPVLGISPLPWHLFTLLVRWLSVLGFVWALRGIWREQTRAVQWMGLLLAVYPGFTQQPVAVAYSQHFITCALFTGSLALMVRAARQPGFVWRLTLPALLMTLLHLMTMEYFAGLELLRPFLLWIILHQAGGKPVQTAGKVLKHWLPYLAVLGVFLAYRLLWYPQLLNGEDPNAPQLLELARSTPFTAALRLAQIALQDSVQVALFAWTNTIAPETLLLNATMTWVGWAVGLAVAALCVWSAGHSAGEPADSHTGQLFVHQSITLGVLGVLLGGLPVWLTNRQVIVGMWSDRFSLAMMFGAVMLLVGIVEWLGERPLRKALFLSVFLLLAVAAHTRTIYKFHLHWEQQRSYFWQLVWRVPALERGTALLAPELPFSYVADYSLSFALNTIYASPQDPQQPPYWFVNASRKWGAEALMNVAADEQIKDGIRNIEFAGSTATSMAVNFNAARGCLRVLDPVYQGAPSLSDYPVDELEQMLYKISHPERIGGGQTADLKTLERIFGKEPPHDWCYYYEKADLARQMQDWQSVRKLGEEAAARGVAPRNGTEWLPFIEADAHLGGWETAVGRTLKAAGTSPKLQPFFCATWQRLETQTTGSSQRTAALAEVRSALKCAEIFLDKDAE
ncbi:MAG: hypothetical protein WHV66_09990 [Anaerolineales bacterium]